VANRLNMANRLHISTQGGKLIKSCITFFSMKWKLHKRNQLVAIYYHVMNDKFKYSLIDTEGGIEQQVGKLRRPHNCISSSTRLSLGLIRVLTISIIYASKTGYVYYRHGHKSRLLSMFIWNATTSSTEVESKTNNYSRQWLALTLLCNKSMDVCRSILQRLMHDDDDQSAFL